MHHFIAEAKKRIAPFPCEGFVVGSGDEDASIMLVGEAPGKTEVDTGAPFTGRAGKVLDEHLALAELTRKDVFITSVVRSRPYQVNGKRDKLGKLPNRAPSKKEIAAHAPFLDAQIRVVRPQLLVPLGNVGLRRLIGDRAKITVVHGKHLVQPILTYQDETYTFSSQRHELWPMFHPAATLHNPNLRPVVRQDWISFGEAIKAGLISGKGRSN
ncbi:uracil-DNA glycosylase [Aureibacillus halotolerans]|uniref:DNA polymerase n=1 Tax=Aureibacillus halotolerans TaxID=1508390 RepID=A0A4R6TV17_9BACI|nr:uracil-DNA glycosylase [Aureibacillus halotolerans]TDQ36073.1 DNA polymerase [Aureibacillus halotolerans]